MRTLFLTVVLLIGCETPDIMEELKDPRTADIVVITPNGNFLKGTLEIRVPNQVPLIIDLTKDGAYTYTTTLTLTDGQGASVKTLEVENLVNIYYKGKFIKSGRQLSIDFEELK